ncbi:PAS domain-containing sensor histidine kinase [Pseudochrobactrum asaccharolyticum]|uniref:PAS domain-containing sensor histidine kinase n=1 Tax=Pseudochrobactrum asaccharolyticum TaxID=354351 RepID=UPI001FE1C306|nr:PAS domain-containing sensor histidine kinase [Pseudochrobactrum asaccharolyticum]
MKNKFYFLPNNGQSSSEIIAYDWHKNPLGPLEGWPSELKNAVQLMLSSHFPKAIIWGDDYTTLYNDAFAQILGAKENCMGKSFRDIWSEAWSSIEPMVADAYKGKTTFIEDYPLIINRNGYPEQCYFTFCYSPILGSDGTVLGMIDTVIEMTSKVEAVKNAEVINSELAHRIKNTFSVIQALANQTFRKNDVKDALPVFSNRLHALANGHDVLRLGSSSNGTIEQVINAVLEPVASKSRVELNGPKILIGPKGVMSTSLLINELTTNAIKYGALSVPEGSIVVNWFIKNDDNTPTLVLEWQERNGPKVVPPKSKGFGSRLIKMGLMGIGASNVYYKEDGLYAVFTAPFRQIQEEGRLYSSGTRNNR